MSFASQQVNDESYTMDSQLITKTKIKEKSISSNISSTITANIHDTKNNIKRHASLFMTLCYPNEKSEKQCKSKTRTNENLSKTNNFHSQMSMQHAPKNRIRNNLILANNFQKLEKIMNGPAVVKRANSQASPQIAFPKKDRFVPASGYYVNQSYMHQKNNNIAPNKMTNRNANKVSKAKHNAHMVLNQTNMASHPVSKCISSSKFVSSIEHNRFQQQVKNNSLNMFSFGKLVNSNAVTGQKLGKTFSNLNFNRPPVKSSYHGHGQIHSTCHLKSGLQGHTGVYRHTSTMPISKMHPLPSHYHSRENKQKSCTMPSHRQPSVNVLPHHT